MILISININHTKNSLITNIKYKKRASKTNNFASPFRLMRFLIKNTLKGIENKPTKANDNPFECSHGKPLGK
jgi:hypothetical protein